MFAVWEASSCRCEQLAAIRDVSAARASHLDRGLPSLQSADSRASKFVIAGTSRAPEDSCTAPPASPANNVRRRALFTWSPRPSEHRTHESWDANVPWDAL